jgi:hypothetical protein
MCLNTMVQYIIGGGGGHMLTVQRFRLIIVYGAAAGERCAPARVGFIQPPSSARGQH